MITEEQRSQFAADARSRIVIAANLLNYTIEWIASNLKPEDISTNTTTGLENLTYANATRCMIRMSPSTLDHTIEWIASNLKPEDVFSVEVLSGWAEDSGRFT